MAPKKKGKKKVDKFGQMSADQRRQYLDRKAAQEQEHGRRREELLAGFLKLKLEDEEKKGGTNKPKLTLKWREILRAAKTKSLQIQLEELLKGVQEASEQQGRLIMVLHEHVEESTRQRTAAAHDNMLAIKRLMGLHEQYVDMLTFHLRKKEAVLLKNVSNNVQNQMASQVSYLREVELVTSAGLSEQYDTEREELAAFHTSITNIRAKLQEEVALTVAEKEMALEQAWFHLASISDAHENQTAALRSECTALKEKVDCNKSNLKKVNQSIKETQSEINNWKSQLSRGPTVNDMVLVERHRLLVGLQILRDTLREQKAYTRRIIALINNRTENARCSLEELSSIGMQIMELHSLCLRLETTRDSNLAFLPPAPVLKFVSSESNGDPSQQLARADHLILERRYPEETVYDSGVGSSVLTSSESRKLASRNVDQSTRDDASQDSTLQSRQSKFVDEGFEDDEKHDLTPIREDMQSFLLEKEAPLERVKELLKDEQLARRMLYSFASNDNNKLSDFVLQESESLLRTQEALRNVRRKHQQVELNRYGLRQEVLHLEKDSACLKSLIKEHLLKIGLSTASLKLQDSPMTIQRKNISLPESPPTREETDDILRCQFEYFGRIRKPVKRKDTPVIQDGKIINKHFLMHRI